MYLSLLLAKISRHPQRCHDGVPTIPKETRRKQPVDDFRIQRGGRNGSNTTNSPDCMTLSHSLPNKVGPAPSDAPTIKIIIEP